MLFCMSFTVFPVWTLPKVTYSYLLQQLSRLTSSENTNVCFKRCICPVLKLNKTQRELKGRLERWHFPQACCHVSIRFWICVYFYSSLPWIDGVETEVLFPRFILLSGLPSIFPRRKMENYGPRSITDHLGTQENSGLQPLTSLNYHLWAAKWLSLGRLSSIILSWVCDVKAHLNTFV